MCSSDLTGEPILYDFVRLSIVIRQYSSPSVLIVFIVCPNGDVGDVPSFDETSEISHFRKKKKQKRNSKALLMTVVVRIRFDSSVGS